MLMAGRPLFPNAAPIAVGVSARTAILFFARELNLKRARTGSAHAVGSLTAVEAAVRAMVTWSSLFIEDGRVAPGCE
jgi:hypothetical protein